MDEMISSWSRHIIRVANGRPLYIMGMNYLYVRIGRYVVRCNSYVCEKLATAYVLVGDFCDRFIEAIKPRKRLIKFEDGTQVPIVRNSSNREANSIPLTDSLQKFQSKGRISHKIWVVA